MVLVEEEVVSLEVELQEVGDIMIKRFITHLCTSKSKVKQLFTQEGLEQITLAVAKSEKLHRAEIRVVIESHLSFHDLVSHTTSRDRAIKLFSDQRVWDTEDNSGVLLYLLIADRTVEIVADRGITRLVSSDRWNEICQNICKRFGNKKFKDGILDGIDEISKLLAKHFPSNGEDVNELSDKPVML